MTTDGRRHLNIEDDGIYIRNPGGNLECGSAQPSLFYSFCSMHCLLSILLYALYFMHCILCIVFYVLYSMHSIIYIVLYALYSKHCMLYTSFPALKTFFENLESVRKDTFIFTFKFFL